MRDESLPRRLLRVARRSLRGTAFELDDERLDVLIEACTLHDKGLVSDATIGACWDSDRLNLWRVGITPSPGLLSSDAARDPELILAARAFHGMKLDWPTLFARYGELTAYAMRTAST